MVRKQLIHLAQELVLVVLQPLLLLLQKLVLPHRVLRLVVPLTLSQLPLRIQSLAVLYLRVHPVRTDAAFGLVGEANTVLVGVEEDSAESKTQVLLESFLKNIGGVEEELGGDFDEEFLFGVGDDFIINLNLFDFSESFSQPVQNSNSARCYFCSRISPTLKICTSTLRRAMFCTNLKSSCPFPDGCDTIVFASSCDLWNVLEGFIDDDSAYLTDYLRPPQSSFPARRGQKCYSTLLMRKIQIWLIIYKKRECFGEEKSF